MLGSIPSAIWIAKIAKGKDFDIREYGSKNAGLTNTFRVLGWKPALPVVFMDLLKGFFGPFIAALMCKAQVEAGGADWSSWVPLVAGLLVILGHSFTCFAGFRGGKGVLAALGVFLAISPITVLIGFATWIILPSLQSMCLWVALAAAPFWVFCLCTATWFPNIIWNPSISVR